MLPPPRKRHGILLPIEGQVRHTYEDTDIVFTSNKRPALLRRDVVNDSVLCAPMVEGKESGLEEKKCSSVFEFDHDEDDDVAPASFMEDDDEEECTDNDPELAFKRKKFHVTTEKKWTVSLLQILNHMNAPDYAYGSIMKWAHDASADGYDFRPRGGLDRSKSVDYLTNFVLNGKLLLPYVRSVDLPHGGVTEEPGTSDVVCFDFVPQLLTLLQNRDIMIADNLAIDIKDPLKPYSSPNGTLDESLSGSVHREAYDRYITKPSSQLFVPIFQWIDRTTIMGNKSFHSNLICSLQQFSRRRFGGLSRHGAIMASSQRKRKARVTKN